MAHKIIQWNCRGLRSNYNDLAILLQEHSPSAVCLQETNLKPNTNISFKNYSIINCFGPANNERACWGVSILVKLLKGLTSNHHLPVLSRSRLCRLVARLMQWRSDLQLVQQMFPQHLHPLHQNLIQAKIHPLPKNKL